MQIPIVRKSDFHRFQIIIEGGQGKQTQGHIALSICMHLWHASCYLQGVKGNVDARGCVRVWEYTGDLSSLLEPKAVPN